MVSSKITIATITAAALAVSATSNVENVPTARDGNESLVKRVALTGSPAALNRLRFGLGHGPVVNTHNRIIPAMLKIARDLDVNDFASLEARFPHGGRRPFHPIMGRMVGGPPHFHHGHGTGNEAAARDFDDTIEARFPHGRGGRPFGRGGPPPFHRMQNAGDARDLEQDGSLEARSHRGGPRGGPRGGRMGRFRGMGGGASDAATRDFDDSIEARFPHGHGGRPFGRGGPPPFHRMQNEARDLEQDKSIEARFHRGGPRGGPRGGRMGGSMNAGRSLEAADSDLEARWGGGRRMGFGGGRGRRPQMMQAERSLTLGEEVLEEVERRGLGLDELE